MSQLGVSCQIRVCRDVVELSLLEVLCLYVVAYNICFVSSSLLLFSQLCVRINNDSLSTRLLFSFQKASNDLSATKTRHRIWDLFSSHETVSDRSWLVALDYFSRPHIGRTVGRSLLLGVAHLSCTPESSR